MRSQKNDHLEIRRDRQRHRITANTTLPGAEATGAVNRQEHFTGTLDEFLEAECGLALRGETCGGEVFWGFYFQEPHQALIRKI